MVSSNLTAPQNPTPGVMIYRVRDEDGRLLPARITIWQDGCLARTTFSAQGCGEAFVHGPIAC